MTTYIFILLMAFFCFTDILYYVIPNWVVLPAIIVGGILTGNWIPAIIMFSIGTVLFKKEKMAGGDVKLMAMTGAFLGMWALPAFILARILGWLYRIIKNYNGMLPFAPFLFCGVIFIKLAMFLLLLNNIRKI